MVYLSCCPMENSPSLLQVQKLANGKLLFSLSLHWTSLLTKKALSCSKKSFCGGVHAVWTSLDKKKGKARITCSYLRHTLLKDSEHQRIECDDQTNDKTQFSKVIFSATRNNNKKSKVYVLCNNYLPVCSLNEWSVQWQKPAFRYHLVSAAYYYHFLAKLPLLKGNTTLYT